MSDHPLDKCRWRRERLWKYCYYHPTKRRGWIGNSESEVPAIKKLRRKFPSIVNVTGLGRYGTILLQHTSHHEVSMISWIWVTESPQLHSSRFFGGLSPRLQSVVLPRPSFMSPSTHTGYWPQFQKSLRYRTLISRSLLKMCNFVTCNTKLGRSATGIPRETGGGSRFANTATIILSAVKPSTQTCVLQRKFHSC